MNLVDSNQTKEASTHFNRLKSNCLTSVCATGSSVSSNTTNENKKNTNTKTNSSSDQENKFNSSTNGTSTSKFESTNRKCDPQMTNGNHVNAASLIDLAKSKRSRVLINDEYCSYCDEGGNLINCDRCPVSFHLICHNPPLDLDKIPKGEFLCTNCTIKAKLYTNSLSRHTVKQHQQQSSSSTLINDPNIIAILKSKQDTSIDLLIKIGKSLNPRQMELSKAMQTYCEFSVPGATKIKSYINEKNINTNNQSHLESHLNLSFINNNKKITSDFVLNKHLNGFENLFNSTQVGVAVGEPKIDDSMPNSSQLYSFNRNNNQNGKQQQQKNAEHDFNLKRKVCCVCEKNGQNVVRCDFCSSIYHFDCLNPPLCSMPAKEKYWMCPKHVEPYLDAKWLHTLRLTDRIKLWMKFNVHDDELDRIKIRNQFIEKCNENSKMLHLDLNCKQTRLFPIQIQSKCLRKSSNIPENVKIMYSRHMKRRRSTSDSFKNNDTLDHMEEREKEDEDERLRAAQSLLNLSAHEQTQLRSDLTFTQQTKAIIRLVSNNFNQKQLKISSRTQIEMKGNVVFIGLDSTMDICLNDFGSINSTSSNEPCQCVSKKHACIYYDELTSTFELLNYSPFGTRVDGFLYSYDLKSVLNENKFGSVPQHMCNCVKDFKSKKRKSWEGPINLRNLSRIELGCFVFEFIILKTDAISNNIDNRNVVKQKFSTCNSSSIFPFKSMKFNDIFAHEKYQVESGYEEILQRKEILKRLKLMRKSFKRFDNKRLEKVLIKNKNHVKVLLKLSNSNQNKKSLL